MQLSTKAAVLAVSLAVAARAPLAAQDVIGTVTATVDGEEQTWHVVTGHSEGRPYASAAWLDLGEGLDMVTLGGFDTPDPPLESFRRQPTGMAISYGSYDGSVIAVAVTPPEGLSAFTIDIDGDDGNNLVSYQPRASVDNVVETTYMMTSGTVEVTRVEISGGTARLEGSFAGTFRLLSGEGELRIENGRFSASGIPSMESIR